MSTQENKRPALETAIIQTEVEIDYLKATLEGKLKWLESDIRGVRRYVEEETYYDDTNLVGAASDTMRLVIRLKYADLSLQTLKALKEEQDKA